MTPASVRSTTVPAKPRTIATLIVVIGVLLVWNLYGRQEVPANPRIAANAALALVLLGLAAFAGLRSADLGLAKKDLGQGALWGGAAFLVVAAFLIASARLSNTGHYFDTHRTTIDLARLWFEALVAIPLGTVLLEEIAFRSVILGLFQRLTSTWRAVTLSSILFGLWHLQGVISSTSGSQSRVALAALGTFAATFVAGLVFSWLRLRSNSLLASAMAHVATNSVALVVAWYRLH